MTATYTDLDTWVAKATSMWRFLESVRPWTDALTEREIADAVNLVDELNGLQLLAETAVLSDQDKSTRMRLGNALATIASRAKWSANQLRPADATT